MLSQTMVISHRDLDPKNVMWNGSEPLVIDWEAAGYVNPYQEFLEVLNYWADDGEEQVKGTIGALYDYCTKVELMKDWLGIKNER